MRIESLDDPDPNLVKFLSDSLFEHNCATTQTRDFREFAEVLRNPEGKVIGGASGWTRWGWLHLDVLWISDDLRNQGWGSRLLERVEAKGRERGCEWATLDTFSFQAPDFYRARGYAQMHEFEMPRHGIRRHFFGKRL